MAKRTLEIPLLTALMALSMLLALPAKPAFAGVTASFRYPLSNFSGPVRSHWAQLAVDHERNEIYALHGRKNDIRVFDEHGMEIFVFGEDFGAADITIGDDGDIFVLRRGRDTATVHLLNYRGERVAEIQLQKVPAAFSEFLADRLVYRNGSLYLVDSDAMKVIVVDEAGRFERGYDLNREIQPYMPRKKAEFELSTVDWRKRQLEDVGLNGFAVDEQGNLFFTVPVMFAAFRLSPHGGGLASFGKPGSGKGKFGVAAGITTDDMGYIYVSDRLRSVVLIFDPNLEFQMEFGFRGSRPSNLIVPDDLAVDGLGNLYVGQAANRGVSVFKIVHNSASLSKASEITPIEASETAPIEASGTASIEASEIASMENEPSGRIVEEVEVDRLEFVVDRGSDAASTDSGGADRGIEEVQSHHNEVNEDE